MARPLVAIVGRPNVGKSMLFNRLVGQRLSIVEDTPGVTRDRLYAECEWCGRKFDIVDTGGIEPMTDSEILLFMREQAQIAINAADVIVLVTDIRTGVTAADKDVANMLLRSRKPVVLAVNKADSTGAEDPALYEFYSLGLGDPIAVSAIHGHGTGDLLDECVRYFPEAEEEDEEPDELAQISKEGYGGILCIETGGPTPGLGCAGRGIIATFQLLEDMELFEHYKPDVVLYDVLGDVVCGGFAAPIREGYADKVLIVTSGEKMALYAANNISSAVRNFEDRSYARVFGIVLNHRNVENEKEKVQAFSEKIGVPIVGEVPRSNEIIHWEEQGKTVIEGDPASEISRCFFDLATLLWKEEENA